MLQYPQVLANGMVTEVDGVHLIGAPFKLSEGGIAGAAPRPTGADTDAVLRDELGLDDDAVAALRADAVIS